MLKICLRELFVSLSRSISHEIILMDNASTDDTATILAEYENKPDVRVVRNKTNLRLNAYKKLFAMAHGRVIIEVDDDILKFPPDFDSVFVDYFSSYSDYGYLALNVVQNEKTNGAKPGQECYRLDVRGEKAVEEGPVGGWCAAFRRTHYRLFSILLFFYRFSMLHCEDGMLSWFERVVMRKRTGIIRDAFCLHAAGKRYAQEYGLVNREVEKYTAGGCFDIARQYSS